MTTTDSLTRLATIRPDEDTLARDWSPARRADVLARVHAATSDAPAAATVTPLTRRRLLPARRLVAASVLLAVGFAGASVVTSGMPSASALESLARTARAQAATAIPAGQFAHLVTTSTQTGFQVSAPDPVKAAAGDLPGDPARTETRVLESWTSADGITWRHDTESMSSAAAAGATTTRDWRFCSSGQFSPSSVAALPTTASALEASVRASAQGSNSADEAVFVALGDLLRLGYADPALRAAAIDVLAGIPGVTTSTVTRNGQPALVVVFRDEAHRPGVAQTLTFDPGTSVLVAEGMTAPDTAYSAVHSQQQFTAEVPAAVVANAENACDTATTKP